MKLLSICIPTYKRPNTLHRCIVSVVEQIQHFSLQEQVQIYVTNDASPDNTAQILDEFKPLDFFKGVSREKNLGMSANIKCMLEEALRESVFQLILTDDDYLQPEVLESIINFLSEQLAVNPDIPLILTPRYSYTEDGNLHTVVCRPHKQDAIFPPSISNAGRYMFNGFVLSGIIVKSSEIDFSLWNEYLENAYFPVIFSGDLILRKRSYFWDKNIIHHSVHNECHWERWGNSDAEISLRLYIDFINAYAAIGKRIGPAYQSLTFYVSALSSIRNFTNGLIIINGGFFRLSDSESHALMNIKRVSFSMVEMPAKILFYLAALKILFDCVFRMGILKLLSIITPDQYKRKKRKGSFERHRQMLANAAFMMRWSH